MGESIRIYVDFGGFGILPVTVGREVLVRFLQRSGGKGKLPVPTGFLIDLVQFPQVLKLAEPKPDLKNTKWYAKSATEAADTLRELAISRGTNSFFIEEIEREGGRSEEGSRARAADYARLLSIPPENICWPKVLPEG